MNARLYDPVLGRFLSPDPFVQMPDFTQNFNRYSYCLNNPLIFVDQSGEFVFTTMLIVGGICAAVFGAGNLTAHATLGYYAEFEFINDNYVKRARQTISQARYHSINVGDCYLGFHRQNRLNQIHVLFDIPVIDTSETTLTILYK